MARARKAILLALLSLFVSGAQAQPAPKNSPPATRLTDAQLRQMLIDESIRAYSGRCPCPYSQDRAGRKCGNRSASSRPGGRAPYCYASDVPQQEVDRLRDSLTTH